MITEPNRYTYLTTVNEDAYIAQFNLRRPQHYFTAFFGPNIMYKQGMAFV